MNFTTLQTLIATIAEGVRRAAPYLLTELLLPGGTLIALLLFLSRYRRARRARAAALAAEQRAAAPTPAVIAPQPAHV